MDSKKELHVLLRVAPSLATSHLKIPAFEIKTKKLMKKLHQISINTPHTLLNKTKLDNKQTHVDVP